MYIHLLCPAENDPAIVIGAEVGGGLIGGFLLLFLTLGVVFVVYRVKKKRGLLLLGLTFHKINLLNLNRKFYICMQLRNMKP